jgi:hypothetical protein
MPMVNVPMKSKPASAQRRFVASYWAFASAPEILLIGEKNRWAPLGSQLIQKG